MVHYPWHPLYRQHVRRQYSERRAAGEIVHVEAPSGVVTVVPAWMLDPVACAGMAIGAPRVVDEVDQHKSPFALVQVTADLLAVCGLLSDQVEEVVLNLERCAEVETEPDHGP